MHEAQYKVKPQNNGKKNKRKTKLQRNARSKEIKKIMRCVRYLKKKKKKDKKNECTKKHRGKKKERIGFLPYK